ncbi:TRAP transporter small permease subunit [Anianabacter salinae]|uniref:TRAP transporter small permease subunit n=1 Tax=Anianabacter salinae TaxID=2851023 RepID=UPI00225E1ABA|nr:TRAP transporter small permease [Anianabacter salinae]MBV0911170.1 TRAP transporter small permease [Anianabacter salinae]
MTAATEHHQPPGPPGGRFTLWLNRLTIALAAIGGLGTLGIMAIINADVVGRGAFGTPVPATAEIVSAAIVAIVFLQLPQATAAGRNVRSDMLLNRLGRMNDRARAALDVFHHAAGTLMLAILLYYIAPGILDSIEGNETVGLYGIFTMPRWPFVVCVLAGCALTFAQYALLTVRFALVASGRRASA